MVSSAHPVPDAVTAAVAVAGWPGIVLPRRRISGVNNVLCNAYGAAELITAIRADAELVRVYGGRGDDAQSGIVLTVPATLHVLAARLENEVRSIVVASQVYTRPRGGGAPRPSRRGQSPCADVNPDGLHVARQHARAG